MKIYLGDLIYDTVKTNHVVPLNIGFIAAYLKEKFKDEVEIKLFKYPKKLEEAIKKSPPDILGLSHYGWNERLNNVFFNLSKKINKNILNVIGGPNIRHENSEIEKFLLDHLNIDYCILHEGEESFCALVDIIINKKDLKKPPNGCATLLERKIQYEPYVYKEQSTNLDIPSPYLTGILDEFIKEPDIIPLFESNRGCPYGCTYCAWGVSALSKIRKRPLEMVLEELEYVAQNSVGQMNWIFADANFGIFDRDINIAKKIKSIKDTKGYPVDVTLWHAKNTSKRNIEIAKILGDREGYIAIQSTDSDVLKKAGRGKIQFKHLQKQIQHYKDLHLNVQTDILIGLPGESKQSHLKTLNESFMLDFDNIQSYNIRMLKGTDYDSVEHRKLYDIKTKYRPIFGCYGIYDGQIIFELEESVIATNTMSEDDLEEFKIIHWFIYFAWNSDIFKPLLRYSISKGLQAIDIINGVIRTKDKDLENIFSQMREESKSEWFDTPDEMIDYYSKKESYEKLTNSFAKLNFVWIAKFFQNKDMFLLLNKALQSSILNTFIEKRISHQGWDELVEINDQLIAINLFQTAFEKTIKIESKFTKYLLNDNRYSNLDFVNIIIYREQKDVDFCNFHLGQNEKEELSIQKLTSFLELGGMKYLRNKITMAP